MKALVRCPYLAGLLLSALLPAAAAAQAPSTQAVFPLFANGTANGITYRGSLKILPAAHGGAATQCTLVQRGTMAAFTGLMGDRYFADVFDGGERPAATTAIRLDTFLPWEVLRSNAAGALATGYAALSCSAAVHSQMQIALSDSQGRKLGETSLQPAQAGRSFEFLLDRRDGTRLGFSLVNNAAAAGEYTVIARDEFNQEIDRSEDTIEAWGQISKFVDELLRLPSSFVGTIEILGPPGGGSYVGGLQFTGSVFTAVSPIVRDSPLSN